MDQITILPNGSEFKSWEQENHYDREYHVSCNHSLASDQNDGSHQFPFLTINAAAKIAVPGTRVWIHGGEYRECVHPVASGDRPDKMISYEAYGDGDVVIKASIEINHFEISTGWRKLSSFDEKHDEPHIWSVRLNPEDYKGYNPFGMVNILHDRLFIEYEKTDMTTYLNRRGMVFCDGEPLTQVSLYHQMSEKENSYWVEANGMTVHFRLQEDADPKDHRIEFTCREQCFAPEVPFLSYIKVKGLICAHAATGAPVPQRGAISCYRGHHWIIEDCEVRWSNGVGIDCGNECWHHEMIPEQVLGYDIIRRCTIRDVGVCGIAGLHAGHFLIEDNLIEGTGWQKMELSWEAGGIKVHNSIGSLIRRNIFKNTIRADHLWMDCGNENNRITQNLFLNGIQQREAIFIECSRDGVNLIDNNIFWNVEGRYDESSMKVESGSKGWYKQIEEDIVNGYAIYGEGTDHLRIVNNLIGRCKSAGYFAKPVSFRMGGLLRGGTAFDADISNNIFYECAEAAIKFPNEKNQAEGNLYVKETGGYLRILTPTPEVCLNLNAWKEFYGHDTFGQEGWFDIEVDTNEYTLMFQPSKNRPFAFGNELKKHNFIYDAELVQEVKNHSMVASDFFGYQVSQETMRVPGPFTTLSEKTVYNIDPRKGR